MPDIPLWGFRSSLGGVVRIFSRSMTATLTMGLIGLLFAPLLQAQDYPADTTRGKAVYERHCQKCHGVGGWGDGPDAQALKVAPANFHRFSSFLKSDEELLRTIEHGVVFSPMHSWRGQLTDGEMQDVVAYVRFLSQQAQ
ncbi:MAG: cytochrome c [Nitrospira sp.]|nr:MAG: cytochrome c [Nitrospira sp.]